MAPPVPTTMQRDMLLRLPASEGTLLFTRAPGALANSRPGRTLASLYRAGWARGHDGPVEITPAGTAALAAYDAKHAPIAVVDPAAPSVSGSVDLGSSMPSGAFLAGPPQRPPVDELFEIRGTFFRLREVPDSTAHMLDLFEDGAWNEEIAQGPRGWLRNVHAPALADAPKPSREPAPPAPSPLDEGPVATLDRYIAAQPSVDQAVDLVQSLIDHLTERLGPLRADLRRQRAKRE